MKEEEAKKKPLFLDAKKGVVRWRRGQLEKTGEKTYHSHLFMINDDTK